MLFGRSQGTCGKACRAVAWVLLDEVSLGFELWRQFNGFPASSQKAPAVVKYPAKAGK
jgi:hypothetical protein